MENLHVALLGFHSLIPIVSSLLLSTFYLLENKIRFSMESMDVIYETIALCLPTASNIILNLFNVIMQADSSLIGPTICACLPSSQLMSRIIIYFCLWYLLALETATVHSNVHQSGSLLMWIYGKSHVHQQTCIRTDVEKMCVFLGSSWNIFLPFIFSFSGRKRKYLKECTAASLFLAETIRVHCIFYLYLYTYEVEKFWIL